jgi:hypothetical protein
MEELKKRAAELATDNELLRAEREREHKKYEATLQSKNAHVKAYGHTIQTNTDSAAAIENKKSKSKGSAAPAPASISSVGSIGASGANRVLPSHLVPSTEDRTRDAEIARLKERIRLQELQAASYASQSAHQIKYNSHIHSSAATYGGSHPIPEILSLPTATASGTGTGAGTGTGISTSIGLSGTIPTNLSMNDLKSLLIATRKELDDKLAIGQSDPELSRIVQSLEDTLRRNGGSPGPTTTTNTSSTGVQPIRSTIPVPIPSAFQTVPIVQPTYTPSAKPTVSATTAAALGTGTSSQVSSRSATSAYHRAAF